MDVEKISKTILKYPVSVTNSHGSTYSGFLQKFHDENMGGYFFYRYRKRSVEVIAGYGNCYAFGIENRILNELKNIGADTIIIETELSYWEISLHDFLEYGIPDGYLKEVTVCIEDFFVRTRKLNSESFNKKKEVNNQKPVLTESKFDNKPKPKYGNQSSLF